MKKTNFLSAAVYAATGIMYLLIVLDVLTNSQNPDFIFNPFLMAVLIVAATGSMLLMSFLADKIKYKKLLIAAAAAVLVFLQAVTIHYLSVKYHVETWDMGVVYNAVKYYVDNGVFDATKYDYFLWFPNNSPLYNIFVLIFRGFALFGIENTQLALNIVNGLILLITAFVTERAATVFAGEKFTANGMILCLLLCPFSLYTVITYTDTFSMLFLALALYFYVCVLRQKGNEYVNLVLFSLFTAIGASLKVSVLILAIAAVIDICIRHSRIRKTAVSLALVIAIAFGGFATMKHAHEHSLFLPEYDYDYTIPHSHWVMMGLNGLGSYNDDDYQNITLAQPDKASRQQANIEEIIRRVEEKGPGGMAEHIANKISFIYSDGTFGACYKLDRAVVRPNGLHEYIIYLGSRFSYLGYFSLALFLAMLIVISFGVFNAIRKKDTQAVMPALSLIGVTLFLILWEARSRYILNFLPIFVLLAVYGIKQIFTLIEREKNI